jgi:hypothetical protein
MAGATRAEPTNLCCHFPTTTKNRLAHSAASFPFRPPIGNHGAITFSTKMIKQRGERTWMLSDALAMLQRLGDRVGQIRDARRIRSLPRIGSIATMPNRAESFAEVVPRLLPQVDRLFVYLDGFDTQPSVVEGQCKIVVFRAEECGNLHASSRLLPLTFLDRPSILVPFDDDILYPADYVARLVEGLAARGGRAIVGFHANCFRPPYQSYIRDRVCFNFKESLEIDTEVDELGIGTCAFLSELFSVDPRTFPHVNKDDIILAIEAKRRGLPRIALHRSSGWLPKYPKPQGESLWARTRKNESVETHLLAQLISPLECQRGDVLSAL